MFPSIETIYRSHLPHRHKDRASKAMCNAFETGQHIEVDFAIWDYAADLAVDYALQNRGKPLGVEAPDGGRLFSEHMVVSVRNFRTPDGDVKGATVNYVFSRGTNGMVFGMLIAPHGSPLPNGNSHLVFAGWTPGKPGFYKSELMNFGADQPTMIQEALQAAFFLSVLSQNRFVRRESGGSRQQKRALLRQYGFAPECWHRVTWNIGEDVKAKVAATDPQNAMPLHFCRAHWRKAQEGQPKAIERNDAPGWWCWVSECWKGHPAFGIKLHHYTPRLRDESLATALPLA